MPPSPKVLLSEPLSPGNLEANGMLSTSWLGSAVDPLRDDGRWATYWVTTNHGWNEGVDAGVLRLRTTQPGSGAVSVEVDFRVALAAGLEHRVEAEMVCDAQGLPALRAWRLRSRTSGPLGEDRPELSVERSAKRDAETGRWVETIGNASHERDWPVTLHGDWALMAGLPRGLDVATPLADRFVVIDNLTAVKPDQRFVPLPEPDRHDAIHGVSLHGFYQTGVGVLPREFWLDAAGRLAMVIDYNRLFIRDSEAVGRYEQLLAERRPSPQPTP